VDHRRRDGEPTVRRILVAADAGVDPHRLVTQCCRLPESEMLSVSLLVPLVADSKTPIQDGAWRAGLLRRASTLADAAGIRLEDFVLADDDPRALDDLVGSGEFDAVVICAANEDASSPVLTLLAQAARRHELAVVESGRKLRSHKGWLSRVVARCHG
jgi:hypothetical protein